MYNMDNNSEMQNVSYDNKVQNKVSNNLNNNEQELILSNNQPQHKNTT